MNFDLVLLAELSLAMIAAGLAAGLLAGLLGVGGGIVTVPVLFHILTFVGVPEGVRMHVAVATSLAAIIPTAIISARSHRSLGAVDDKTLRIWLPAVLAGAAVGTASAAAVKGPVLSAVFAAGAFGVALYMLLRGADREDEIHAAPVAWVQRCLASAIGAISAMMGIGGGTFAVPTLRHFGFPMRRAVGTASAFGFVIALPAAIGYALAGFREAGLPPGSLGYVNLLGLLLLAPLTTLAAPWGARIAHRISPNALRLAFVIFLFLTSARMALSLV